MKIDKLDLEIIKNLQDDARLSFRQLAKKLNIPHTTVFTRAERLVKKGVINKFAAVMHPHELGLQTGYVIINAPPSESKNIAKKLASYSEVQDVFRTFDGKVISRVVVSNKGNNTGFEEFLTKLDNCNFTAYPVHDVVKYETAIQTDMLKTLDIYEDK
ncbi:MAG: winged helix-turn-helix transcriptional regulator [Candidatus Altiarchaeia archaeon]|jgi:DNA-binding Lrp family transcriptional regulator